MIIVRCWEQIIYWSFTIWAMTKPTKWHVRPAKTQISLGIRPVWSESSLCAWRKVGSLVTHWAHSEDSDQTGYPKTLIRLGGCPEADLSLRWAHSHFISFVMRRLICLITTAKYATWRNCYQLWYHEGCEIELLIENHLWMLCFQSNR